MIPFPMIDGYVQAYVDQGPGKPAIGKGKITYYPDILNVYKGHIDIELVSSPWNETGVQPFAWDMLPPIEPPPSMSIHVDPIAKRTNPKIRLVLSPSVEFTVKTIGMGINTREGWINPDKPIIEVFRPQDALLIPQPGEPIEQSRFLEEPYSLKSFERLPVVNEEESVIDVVPYPQGIEFFSNTGGYSLTIHIEREDKPAAFAYEIIKPGPFLLEREEPTIPMEERQGMEAHRFRIRIVHTDNVKITAQAHPQERSSMLIETRWVYNIDAVPSQGSSLDDFKNSFTYFKVPGERPQRSGWITLFELGVGFIPYIGALYNLSQLVYATCTGRDFWGYKVSGLDFVMMGIAAVIPLALKSKPRVTSLQTDLLQKIPVGSNQRILAQALDQGVTDAVMRAAEKELLEAVGHIDVNSATELGRKLIVYATGNMTAKEFLTEFDRLVANAFLRELDKRAIERVMVADFQNFKNPTLAQGFNEYKTTHSGADLIDWAISQRKNSRYFHELQTELGVNWKEILRRSRNNDVRLRPVPDAELVHYDRLAGILEDYGSLSMRNAKHGKFFEVDHILEQRFWRNDPRIGMGFDEKSLGLSMLVPKNPKVASKMVGRPIAYVHTTKTQMLKYLIPNGQEALYTVQEIWDAHVFVFRNLKLEDSVLFTSRLTSEFKIFAAARGEQLITRIPSAFKFNPKIMRWEAF